MEAPKRRQVNELSEQELAERSGTTVQQLRHLVELGIISPTDRAHQPSDIQRIRIVQALSRAGITSEEIGQLIVAGAYSMAWADQLFPEPTPQVPTTFEQAVDQLQLPASFVERLYASWELARPEWGQALRADDAELLGLAAVGYSVFGRDETVALSVARQLGESLRRLAESQMRLFRSRIEEPLIASGTTQLPSNGDAISAIAMPLLAALERTVLLLYHRHLEYQVLETIVLRAELKLEQAGVAKRRPDRPPAIAFLDLTGYTNITEQQGDQAAAELAAQFVDVVHTVAHQHGGRPVKLLGDGVMFHFPEPARGVLCGLELVERIPQMNLPRARMGVSTGPVVFQDGDYFGRTVNLAARITDYARPGEVLVSDEVVTASNAPQGVRYRPIGSIELKGVATPVTLHTAVRTG